MFVNDKFGPQAFFTLYSIVKKKNKTLWCRVMFYTFGAILPQSVFLFFFHCIKFIWNGFVHVLHELFLHRGKELRHSFIDTIRWKVAVNKMKVKLSEVLFENTMDL